MSKHSGSRGLAGQLRVLGSVVVVVAFVALFVAGAIGRGGGSDDVSRGVSDPGEVASGASGTPTDGASGSGAATATDSGTGTTAPTPAASTNAADPQDIARAKKLKHTLAWLRRGLADETTFRVSTLNVLGDSHTSRGGNKGGGWASGTTRMNYAYQLLTSAEIDVVGFQELETPQYNQFRALGGAAWDAFPGPTLDRGSIRNSIAWRTDTWQLVDAESIAIPYFHGQPIRTPYVKLENVQSHRQVWFFNTHNPASTPRWGNNAHWRAVAIGMEIDLANQLTADGTPVVFLGDYNDRAEAFCPLTGETALVAAAGGSGTDGCVLPPQPGIDWIFGAGVQFSDYASATQGVVGRVTDHPFVYAQGYIPEEPLGGQSELPSPSESPSESGSGSPSPSEGDSASPDG